MISAYFWETRSAEAARRSTSGSAEPERWEERYLWLDTIADQLGEFVGVLMYLSNPTFALPLSNVGVVMTIEQFTGRRAWCDATTSGGRCSRGHAWEWWEP